MTRRSLAMTTFLAALAAAGCQSDGLGRARPPVSCTPACLDRDCGEDGCGGTCGQCAGDLSCDPLSGLCVGGNGGIVRGTLTFEYRPGVVDPSGGAWLDAVDLMPGVGMMAVVAAADGTVLGSREVKAADGAFQVPVSRPVEAGDQLLLSTFFAPDDEVVLAVLQPPPADYNPDLALPVWTWSKSIPTGGRMGDVRIREDQGSGAMFLHLINRRAQGSVLEAVFEGNPVGMVRLGLLWAPGLMWQCGACFASSVGSVMEAGPKLLQSIFIGDEPDGSGPWSWPVLLHEFGHYVAENYSRDNSPGGPHYIGEILPPAFAWSEGWASFFGAMTATRWFGQPEPVYWDIQSGSSFWIDFDAANRSDGSVIGRPNPRGSPRQDLDENFVTQALWTLWTGKEGDGATGDGLTTDMILRSVSSQRFLDLDPGMNGSDLVDFLDSAACLDRDLTGTLRDVSNDTLGFPWDGDPTCPSTMGFRTPSPSPSDAARARGAAPLRVLLDAVPTPDGLRVRASVDPTGIPAAARVFLTVRAEGATTATGGPFRWEASSAPGRPAPVLEGLVPAGAGPVVAEARALAPGFGARSVARWPAAPSPGPRLPPTRRPIAPVHLGPVTLTGAIPLD